MTCKYNGYILQLDLINVPSFKMATLMCESMGTHTCESQRSILFETIYHLRHLHTRLPFKRMMRKFNNPEWNKATSCFGGMLAGIWQTQYLNPGSSYKCLSGIISHIHISKSPTCVGWCPGFMCICVCVCICVYVYVFVCAIACYFPEAYVAVREPLGARRSPE